MSPQPTALLLKLVQSVEPRQILLSTSCAFFRSISGKHESVKMASSYKEIYSKGGLDLPLNVA